MRKVVEILNTYGHGKIERSFNFKREKDRIENLAVIIQCDATLTAEQTEKIVAELDKFIEKMKKVVEEF